MKLIINKVASPKAALIRAVDNNTPTSMPALVLADTIPLTIYLADGAGDYAPESGNVTTWGVMVGVGMEGDATDAYTDVFTQTADGKGWEGVIYLGTAELLARLGSAIEKTLTFEVKLTGPGGERRTVLQAAVLVRAQVIDGTSFPGASLPEAVLRPAGTPLTLARIPFANASGQLIDDGDLRWDNTNKRIGVGLTTPLEAVHVQDDKASTAIRSQNTTETGSAQLVAVSSHTSQRAMTLLVYGPTTAGQRMGQDLAGAIRFSLFGSTRNFIDSFSSAPIIIGTADTARLFIAGNGHLVGLGGVTTNVTHQLTLPNASTGIAIYNTADRVTNFERLLLDWSGNVARIMAEKGGTGSFRSLLLRAGDATNQVDLSLARTNGPDGFMFDVNSDQTTALTGYRFRGTNNASANALSVFLSRSQVINQTGQAGYIIDRIDVTENTTGTGARWFAYYTVGGFSNFRFGVTSAGKADCVAGVRLRSMSAPGSPEDGDAWNDSTEKAMRSRLAGINQTLAGKIATQTAYREISNSTVEQTLFGTIGQGTLTLPANFWTVGKVARVTLWGTQQHTTGSVTVRAKLGSTAMAELTGTPPATFNRRLKVEAILTCRSTGASGLIVCTLFQELPSETYMTSSAVMQVNSSANVNTGASMILDVTGQFGTANSGNVFSVSQAIVEVL